jgi:hypothetical protein
MIDAVGLVTNTAPLRRAVYEHRHGSLVGWHNGWYCEYFNDGTFSQGRYAKTHGTHQLWCKVPTRGRRTAWKLTSLGRFKVKLIRGAGYTVDDVQSKAHCYE